MMSSYSTVSIAPFIRARRVQVAVRFIPRTEASLHSVALLLITMWQQTLGYQYAPDPYALANRRQVGAGLLSTPGGLLSTPGLVNYPQVAMDSSGGLMVLPYNVPHTLYLPPTASIGATENIKVNWATTSVKKKERTFSLFVGDLTPEIDETLLAKTFEPFGTVVDARVVKDMNTGHSKGYGFVAFSKEADADLARTKMNGYYLGGKAIRTNWAARKPIQTRGEAKEYDIIYKKTSDANTTVYIGNTPDDFKESDVRAMFEPHGQISEVRVYPDRNYAFVKYSDHEQATRAIVACHGQMVEDRPLKCDWGRDEGQSKSSGSSGSSQPYGQQQQQQQAAYQQAALLYNQFSQQQATPFQQQPQQQQPFSSNPPPGIYGQQAAFVSSSQSQMYPYFDSSSMMVPNQFASYGGQDSSHGTYLGQQSSTGATSQGSFGYQQQ